MNHSLLDNVTQFALNQRLLKISDLISIDFLSLKPLLTILIKLITRLL